MREIIEILNEAFDDSGEDHSGDLYERERLVTSIVEKFCRALDIPIRDRGGVSYMEEDNRSVFVRVEGDVTLEQLSQFTKLGTGVKIYGNASGYGIVIEFSAKQKMTTPEA